jgi:hypothetical protein
MVPTNCFAEERGTGPWAAVTTEQVLAAVETADKFVGNKNAERGSNM